MQNAKLLILISAMWLVAGTALSARTETEPSGPAAY